MKDKIVEILKTESFNVLDEAGNNYVVVEDSNFNEIAEKNNSIIFCPCT